MNKNLESEEDFESFYFIIVLKGEINDLEEIERYITTEYIDGSRTWFMNYFFHSIKPDDLRKGNYNNNYP